MSKRAPLAVLAFFAFLPLQLRADTLYQTTARGRQVVLQRDCIVVKDTSTVISYKHFELKDHRVEKVGLNKGSLPYYFEASPAAEQQAIVERWRKFGYTATITDRAGKATRVSDLYIDFYPPGGRGSLLESVLPRTTLPIATKEHGADEIEFSRIAIIQVAGDSLKVSLSDGQVVEGKFLMPTSLPAEARFLGITDRYDPASEDVFDFAQPLGSIKEVRFEP